MDDDDDDFVRRWIERRRRRRVMDDDYDDPGKPWFPVPPDQTDGFFEVYVPLPGGDSFDKPNMAFWRCPRGYWHWRVLSDGKVTQRELGASAEDYASKAEAKAAARELAHSILFCMDMVLAEDDEEMVEHKSNIISLQKAREEMEKAKRK